VKLSEKLAINL